MPQYAPQSKGKCPERGNGLTTGNGQQTIRCNAPDAGSICGWPSSEVSRGLVSRLKLGAQCWWEELCLLSCRLV